MNDDVKESIHQRYEAVKKEINNEEIKEKRRKRRTSRKRR